MRIERLGRRMLPRPRPHLTASSVLGLQTQAAGAITAIAGQAESRLRRRSRLPRPLFQPSIFPLLPIARATARVRLGAPRLNPFDAPSVEIAGQVARSTRRRGAARTSGSSPAAGSTGSGSTPARWRAIRETWEMFAGYSRATKRLLRRALRAGPGAGLEYEPLPGPRCRSWSGPGRRDRGSPPARRRAEARRCANPAMVPADALPARPRDPASSPARSRSSTRTATPLRARRRGGSSRSTSPWSAASTRRSRST